MALTHELSRRNSPVRVFFEDRFPSANFKSLSAGWYDFVRAADVVCPLPEGVNPGTIGTAFDYRARLCWAPLEWLETVAAEGAILGSRLGRPQIRRVADELREELVNTASERRVPPLPRKLEKHLCRCCYGLSLYEQLARSLQAHESTPLLQLQADATLEQLFQLAPDQAIDDLVAMTELLQQRQDHLLNQPAVLNPRFEGSAEIGGADADLIVDGLLLELKTTKQEKFERVGFIYQLLGYLLLDYSDEYSISSIGIYLARRGLLVRWPLADVLALCGDTKSVEVLRGDFRALVKDALGNPETLLSLAPKTHSQKSSPRSE